MKKKQLNKKNKLIIIVSLIILVLGVSTCTGIYLYNKNQESKQEEPIIKKSPYTLEEIYEIVDDIDLLEKKIKDRNDDFAYVICHFYDYFSKSTPFKRAKVKYIEPSKMELIETTTIDYYEYMRIMDGNEFYEYEKEKIENDIPNSPNKMADLYWVVTYYPYALSIVFDTEIGYEID